MNQAWREVLARLRAHPGLGGNDLLLLGVLVSGPPLVPAALLRRVRRTLLPGDTLYIEAHLCRSRVAESFSRDGLELEAEFRAGARAVLREAILEADVPADGLRPVLDCTGLGLSPLLEVEERLVWSYLTLREPADACDADLAVCLRSSVHERRPGIVDWAAGALWRLPPEVRRAPAAWLLGELCRTRGAEVPTVATPPVARQDQQLLREVLTGVPRRFVGLRRDGTSLSFGPPDPDRRVAVPVPDLSIRPVSVTWTGEDGTTRREEVDLADRGVELPTGRSAVTLATMDGARFELEPVTGDVVPEITALNEGLTLLEDRLVARRPIVAQVVRHHSRAAAVVRFTEAPLCTGLLHLDRAQLTSGMHADDLTGEQEVILETVDREQQRVECKPTTVPEWSPGMLRVGSWVEGTVAHQIESGLLVRVPTGVGPGSPGIVGLLRRMHMSPSTDKLMGTFPVPVGHRLAVRVLQMDPAEQHLLLSMWPEDSDDDPVVTAHVVRVAEDGIVIVLATGEESALSNWALPIDLHPVEGDVVSVQVARHGGKPGRPRLHPPRDLYFTLAQAPPETRLMARAVRTGDLPRLHPLLPTGETEQDVRDFVAATIRGLTEPLLLTSLAMRVITRFGTDFPDGWFAFSGFKSMVVAIVPGVVIDSSGPSDLVLPLSSGQ